MKNKILSYLFGGLLVIPMCFMFGYVHADCESDCAIAGIEGKASCIAECEAKNKEQQQQEKKGECNGIKLNTNFPGIGTCISTNKTGTNPTNVFQKMMRTMTKLVMSIILVVCFITIIIAGIMRAGAGEDSSQKTKAKNLIKKVAITILLVGFSGVILRAINPNFFG